MAETPFNSAAFAGTKTIGEWQDVLADMEAFYGRNTDLKIADTYAASITGRTATNSVAPVASGTVTVGQVLSVTTGTWSPTPTAYEYQWYNNATGNNLAGTTTTASTYTLVAGDVGATPKVRVTAVLRGRPVSAVSNTLGTVS